MTEQEFNQAIDEVFKNTNGMDIPYIDLFFTDGYILIDGDMRYEDLVKLGEVVKMYLENKNEQCS
jgi:hypothetical protein